MNSVKISGLVLMGAFTVGITSGSVVSAVAGTEAISGTAGEAQEGELTELNNGKGAVNDSDAETEASENSGENQENSEGNLVNGDSESSEKEKSGNAGAAKIAGYVAGGIGTAGALGTGAKLAYDKFAKAKQGEENKSGSGEEENNNNNTKPDPNGTDSMERENSGGSCPTWVLIVGELFFIILGLSIIFVANFIVSKYGKNKYTIQESQIQ